jgi:CubicO group peptidase (beta-lactamase class C family)
VRWLLLSLLFFSAADVQADLRQWLDDEVPSRMDKADIPAVVIAVVRGDQTLLVGYGADPVRDVFRVGSVSKPVAASVILELVRQGEFALDEDVSAALEPLHITPALTGPLTLHHLLTHTAGFSERLFGQHARSAADFLTLDRYLKKHLPPRFIEPGLVIAYNDHHTALASWLVEQQTGKSFAAVAEAMLFKPLGLNDSTFVQLDLPEAYAERRIRAVRTGTGPAYPADFIQLPAAAGLYTTAKDMAVYMRALLQHPERQLQVQFRHHARLPGRAYGFAEGRHGSDATFFKDGQASGFNARLLLYPAQQSGVFVAHNRNIFGPLGRIEAAGRFNRTLGADLLEEFWPQPSVTVGPVAEQTGVDLATYVGSYRTVIAARHSWERLVSLFDEVQVTRSDGVLMMGSQRYVPVAENLFVHADDAQRYIAFRVVDGNSSHVFIGGGAYERVPWWTTQSALPWLVGLPAGILLLTGLLLVRTQPGLTVLGHGTLLIFLVGLGLLFWLIDLQQLFYGAPKLLLSLLVLPLIAAGAFAVQSVRLMRHFSSTSLLGVIAGVTLLIWLGYWNLLGFHLG